MYVEQNNIWGSVITPRCIETFLFNYLYLTKKKKLNIYI